MRIGGLAGGGSISNVFNATDAITFNFEGIVQPTVGTSRWYPPQAVTLKTGYFSVAAVGVDETILQLSVNGVAVGDPIVCAPSEYKSAIVNLSVPVGITDYVSVDLIDGNTAENLTVNILFEYQTNLPIAAQTSVGVVKPGTYLTISPEGVIGINLPVLKTALGL